MNDIINLPAGTFIRVETHLGVHYVPTSKIFSVFPCEGDDRFDPEVKCQIVMVNGMCLNATKLPSELADWGKR